MTSAEYRIKQAGIPDHHAQRWILLEDLGHRMRVRRVEDPPDRPCILPTEWLEPVAPPVPDEPGPGAWQIGDRLCVRFAADATDIRWAVELPPAEDPDGYTWHTWAELWKRYGGPDVQILRLVPETTMEHDDCPLPYPGEAVAERLPGGGWICTSRNHMAMPRFSNDVPVSDDCDAQRDDVVHEFSGVTIGVCSRHLITPDGRKWHIAGCGTAIDVHAIAVWPVKAGA